MVLARIVVTRRGKTSALCDSNPTYGIDLRLGSHHVPSVPIDIAKALVWVHHWPSMLRMNAVHALVRVLRWRMEGRSATIEGVLTALRQLHRVVAQAAAPDKARRRTRVSGAAGLGST